MKRVLIVVLVAIAVVLVGVVAFHTARSTFGILAGGGRPTVPVALTMQNGVCSVQGPVGDLGGGYRAPIKWDVTNNCTAPAQYVSFLEYREDFGPGSYGPIEKGIVDPDPAPDAQHLRLIAPGGRDSIDARIVKLHFSHFGDRRYKYKICVGPAPNPTTNCLDPDVDVWPF
jgi:hypothetical protein